MKLEIEKLVKSYGDNLVLDNINFEFESNKIYGLLGRNGAGKTTFFNCINQDIDINDGLFYLTSDKKEKLDTKDIGYVTATPVVPEFLTGREFVQFYLDINKDKIDDIKDINYYFNLVKLNDIDQDILIKEYSQGMKNKIQLLINIISKSKVLLLDEPLTSLDIVVQEEMKKLLKKLKKDHIIILSTHILELALDLCDEIVVLSNKNFKLIDKGNKNYKKKIIEALKEDEND